jgi:hypothetical protein
VRLASLLATLHDEEFLWRVMDNDRCRGKMKEREKKRALIKSLNPK